MALLPKSLARSLPKSRSFWRNTFGKLREVSLLNRQAWPEIVSTKDLHELRQLTAQDKPTPLDVNLEVQHKMLGERLSPFAKNGFEFAETRLYQYGDNIRFINWRRYANTGQLFVNTFHEERRPQCWIMLDRRASMRFGTRVRLKVAQAARLALHNLFKAQRQQFDIGGVILDQNSHWYDAKSSNTSFQPFIQHICSPCPPLADTQNNLLTQNLRLLKARLSPGCLIVLISDFIDLQKTDINILNALAGEHSVTTIHIVDPIEKELPKQGQFQILNPSNESLIQLNCENPNTKASFQQRLKEKLDNIEQQLIQGQAHYQQIDSSGDFLT